MSKMMRVPEGWEVKKVSQISKTFAGGTPNRENFTYYNGNIPWVKSGEVNQSSILKTEETITQDGLDNSNAKFVPKGTILVAMYGATAGKIALLNIDATTNQAVLAIPLKNDNIFFIRYMLEFHMPKLVFQAQGSGQPNLSKQMVDNMLLLLPSKKEQEKIAKILSTLDKAIESTSLLIEKEKNIKTALMQELLTNGIDQNGQIRSPKTHTYKPSELGLIPDEWELTALNKISSKISDGIHTTPIYSDNSNFYFINGNNLENGDIVITEKTNCVDEEEYNKHKINLTEKTILLSVNGTIGNLAFYKNEKVVLGKSVAYIICKDNIDIDFLSFLLSSNAVLQSFELNLTGSTIKNLSIRAIKETKIIYPSINEQKQIAKTLTTQDKKIQTEETNLAKLKELKKGLMNDLLSGKVRVKI